MNQTHAQSGASPSNPQLVFSALPRAEHNSPAAWVVGAKKRKSDFRKKMPLLEGME